MKRQRGFSLVELLVVLAIIALMIAFLMPALAGSKASALSSQCQSNLRQIGLAITNYAAANADYVPNYAYNTAPYADQWSQSLASYMGVDSTAYIGKSAIACPAFVAPQVPGGGTNGYSYGVNFPGVTAWVTQTPPPSPDITLSGGARLPNIPTYVFLAGDCLNPVDEPSSAIFSPLLYPFTNDTNGDGVNDTNNTLFAYNGFDPRHIHGSGNMVFADVSVRAVSILDWETNSNGMWGADDLTYK